MQELYSSHSSQIVLGLRRAGPDMIIWPVDVLTIVIAFVLKVKNKENDHHMQGLHDAAGEKVRAEVRGLGGQSVAETRVAVWCSSVQAAMEGQATMCECLQGVWAGMAAVGCGNKHLSPTITYRGGAWRMGTVGCTKNKAGRKVDGVPLIASGSGCWCAGTPLTVH